MTCFYRYNLAKKILPSKGFIRCHNFFVKSFIVVQVLQYFTVLFTLVLGDLRSKVRVMVVVDGMIVNLGGYGGDVYSDLLTL